MIFGIVGTADIAVSALVPAIEASDHTVGAIASRDADRAVAVADELDVPTAYGSYEALLADDAIDAVYNPLPNALHAEWTSRAIDAGKPVLVEKPFGVDRAQAARIIAKAREHEVSVMEAFMYRFHPRTERAIEIAREELTDVHTVSSEFSFSLPEGRDDIRLDPSLAGGSVMDVGCYAVSATRQFLGEPDRVNAITVDRRDAGVDTEMAAILSYEDGSVGRIASGFDSPLTQRYRVAAANGWLEVRSAFDAPADAVLSIEYEIDGERSSERFDPVDQYRLQVEHFADVVADRATPRIDAAETLGNMAVVDAIYRSATRDGPAPVERATNRDSSSE